MAHSNRKRPTRGKGAEPWKRSDEFFKVEPEHVAWPQESWCRNVMCRRRWMREFGESEFCVACRRMLERK